MPPSAAGQRGISRLSTLAHHARAPVGCGSSRAHQYLADYLTHLYEALPTFVGARCDACRLGVGKRGNGGNGSLETPIESPRPRPGAFAPDGVLAAIGSVLAVGLFAAGELKGWQFLPRHLLSKAAPRRARMKSIPARSCTCPTRAQSAGNCCSTTAPGGCGTMAWSIANRPIIEAPAKAPSSGRTPAPSSSVKASAGIEQRSRRRCCGPWSAASDTGSIADAAASGLTAISPVTTGSEAIELQRLRRLEALIFVRDAGRTSPARPNRRT